MLKAGIEIERAALAIGDAAPDLHDEADALRLREAVQSAQQILEKHARSGDFGMAAKKPYDPSVLRSRVNGEEVGATAINCSEAARRDRLEQVFQSGR